LTQRRIKKKKNFTVPQCSSYGAQDRQVRRHVERKNLFNKPRYDYDRREKPIRDNHCNGFIGKDWIQRKAKKRWKINDEIWGLKEPETALMYGENKEGLGILKVETSSHLKKDRRINILLCFVLLQFAW